MNYGSICLVLIVSLTSTFVAQEQWGDAYSPKPEGNLERAEPRSLRFTNPRDKRKESAKPWNDVLNSGVRAEGIAWGSFEKGFGEYLIMNGVRIYVKDISFLERNLHGKIVQVTGFLKRRTIEKADKNSAGPSTRLEFYEIVPVEINELNKVEWPYLVEQKISRDAVPLKGVKSKPFKIECKK